MSKATSEKLSYQTNIIFIFIFLLNPFVSYAWHGKVVDPSIGLPVEGAVVLRSWDLVSATPAGMVSSLYKCKEGISDSEGRFHVERIMLPLHIPLVERVEENPAAVYKPGYAFVELDEHPNLVKLKKIPTDYSLRYAQVYRPFRTCKKLPLFKDIISRELELLESWQLLYITPVSVRSKPVNAVMRPSEKLSAKQEAPNKPAVESHSGEALSSHAPKTPARVGLNTHQKGRKAPYQKKDIDIRTLIDDLYGNDIHAGIRAGWALADIGSPALPHLLKALKSRNPDVRQIASNAILKIGAPAVDSLIHVLEHWNYRSKSHAVRILGDIKDPRAIEPLIACLCKAENAVLRRQTAQALARFESIQAVNGLLSVLNHENAGIRTDAAQALGQIGDPAAVGPLLEMLKDREWTVRYQALVALTKIPDPRSTAPAVRALGDVEPKVRSAAIKCILKRKPFPEKLIVHALSDENRYVRINAARIIGARKELSAVEPLIETLKDKDPIVRAAAIQSLGKIEDPRAVKPLGSMLKIGKNSKISVIRSLSKIKTSESVEILMEELLKPGSRKLETAIALGNLGTISVAPLISALKNKDREIRYHASGALGQIGDPIAVTPLVKLWKDPDSGVRKSAANALTKIGPEAVDTILQALKDNRNYIRWKAVWTLGKIKAPKISEALISALNDPAREVRWIAARALGGRKEVQAVKPLFNLIHDEDPGLRTTALTSLKAITGLDYGMDLQKWEHYIIKIP
jgi:HEAT repeat protein